MCEHNDEMRFEYQNFGTVNNLPFCGDHAGHAPHEGCAGIMCDYGCNAEDF